MSDTYQKIVQSDGALIRRGNAQEVCSQEVDQELRSQEVDKRLLSTNVADAISQPDSSDDDAEKVDRGKFEEPHEKILDKLEYPRHGTNPGVVVIFNQLNFDNDDENELKRRGSIKDVNDVMDSFGRLGYNIEEKHVHIDFSRQKILEELKRLSTEDYSDANCLIIFFFTHGKSNNVLLTRDGQIGTEELWEPFFESKCKSFQNKPKFFVIQACKGEGDSTVSDVQGEIVPPETYHTPLEPNILIAFAAVEGSRSRRDTLEGSWFIQEFCKNIAAFGRRDDVISLLLRVTKCIANNYYHMDDKLYKQMPLFISTLGKKFYLTTSKDRQFKLNLLERTENIKTSLQAVNKKLEKLQPDTVDKKERQRNND